MVIYKLDSSSSFPGSSLVIVWLWVGSIRSDFLLVVMCGKFGGTYRGRGVELSGWPFAWLAQA